MHFKMYVWNIDLSGELKVFSVSKHIHLPLATDFYCAVNANRFGTFDAADHTQV